MLKFLQDVDAIVREFIVHERHHMMMEDRDFFLAALKALKPEDWTEIASAVTVTRIRCSAMSSKSGSMRYAPIFCGWSKRLKPSEGKRAFIRSAWLCFKRATPGFVSDKVRDQPANSGSICNRQSADDLRIASDEIGRESDASNQTQHAARRRKNKPPVCSSQTGGCVAIRRHGGITPEAEVSARLT
jgi:hypothetical protein